MPRIQKIMVNGLLSLLSVLGVLIVIEISTNFYLWNIADAHFFNIFASVNQLEARYGQSYLTNASGMWSPHRYLGHYATPNYDRPPNRHNTLGFRGDELEVPKPAGMFRVVALGGSTTYSMGVEDYTESYPYRLQEILRDRGYTQVEVVNAGASSYATLESLINLETRVLDLDPDMLIIYHGINDIHLRLVWPPEAYRSDNSGARTLRLQTIRMPSILEYSTFFRMLMIQFGLTQPHSSLDWNVMDHPDTWYGDEYLRQKQLGIYPDGILREVSAQTMLETNAPIYFERNLRSMIAIADTNGIEVLLATFAYSPHFPDFPRVAEPEYQWAFAQQNEVVRQITADTSAYLVDFAAAMPDDVKYFTDGRHFTAEGNTLRATLFADYLIDNDLIPLPES